MPHEPGQECTEVHRSDPWDQLPGEPDREYARFVEYLGMRDRRQSKAALSLGISERLVKKVRAQWRWVERADAYDKAQAQQVLADTVRLRNEAAASLLEGILGSADALKDALDEDRDPKALQSLAAAVRSLTPVTEVTVSSPGDTGPDVVEVAFRRAQQIRTGQEESDAGG